MQGEHEFLCCGARVKICGKRIRVVSEPKVLRCPLNEALYRFKSTNKDTVMHACALTKKGKRFVLNYLSTFSEKTVVFRSNLPYLVEGREPTLKE